MVLMFCGGCSVNPVTGENELILVSKEQTDTLGAQAAEQVNNEMGADINDLQLTNYVNSIGQKIVAVSHTPNEPFRFNVIKNDTVNAFALPGGYIYVTSGMLYKLKNEAQLAAILAHETVHVTARHTQSQMSHEMAKSIVISLGASASKGSGEYAVRAAQIISQLEGLKYSRTHESVADEYGLGYLYKAGYDPYEMVRTMEMLRSLSDSRPIEFLSTHPDPDNRVERLKELIQQRAYGLGGRVAAEDYQKYVLNRLPSIVPPPKENNK